MCTSRKYPYSPHGMDWKILGGGVGGFPKTQIFKEMDEVELEFPEGWGALIKNPFHGGGMESTQLINIYTLRHIYFCNIARAL